jgi:hypothetical protein
VHYPPDARLHSAQHYNGRGSPETLPPYPSTSTNATTPGWKSDLIVAARNGSEPLQDQLANHSSAFYGQVGFPQVFRADTAEVLREG